MQAFRNARMSIQKYGVGKIFLLTKAACIWSIIQLEILLQLLMHLMHPCWIKVIVSFKNLFDIKHLNGSVDKKRLSFQPKYGLKKEY